MPVVTNKTQKPVSVPLPGGKTLHLGPGKDGQISPRAAQSSGLLKLIEASQVEVDGKNPQRSVGTGVGKKGRTFIQGHASSGTNRRSGDR